MKINTLLCYNCGTTMSLEDAIVSDVMMEELGENQMEDYADTMRNEETDGDADPRRFHLPGNGVGNTPIANCCRNCFYLITT